MRPFSLLAVGLMLSLSAATLAAPLTDQSSKGRPGAVSISAPAGKDRIRISVSLISYPGVPERSSCRLLFRATNETGERVELSTLLHTFDSQEADLNSWLIPTGEMAPGQQIERLYSCKGASFLTLDQRSDYGWPSRCVVAGQMTTPCPVALNLDSNLRILSK